MALIDIKLSGFISIYYDLKELVNTLFVSKKVKVDIVSPRILFLKIFNQSPRFCDN